MAKRQREVLIAREVPGVLDLVAAIVKQPTRSESPWVQAIFESVNHQGLSSNDDMQEHELFKRSHALLVDHVARDPVNVGKVLVILDQCLEVEVGRDRLKGRTRSRCWHFGRYVRLRPVRRRSVAAKWRRKILVTVAWTKVRLFRGASHGGGLSHRKYAGSK